MNHIYHLPEHQTLRDQMQRFLERKVEPYGLEWEKSGKVPRYYAPPPVSPVSIELFVDVTYGSKPAISAAACAFFRCASDVLPPVTGAAASVLLDPLQRDASTLGLSPAGGAKARPCVVAS